MQKRAVMGKMRERKKTTVMGDGKIRERKK